MAGSAGTPRFGVYDDKHKKQTNSQGDSTIALQDDGDFDEIHFTYDASARAREMGSTEGQAPAKYWESRDRQYDAPSNHDGWFGGDAHLVSLDERKVLDNCIYSQKIECADEVQHNWNSVERSA